MIRRTLGVLVFALALSGAGSAQNGSWRWQNPLPQGNDLHAVRAIDLNTFHAAGAAGTVMKSTDGGTTWSVRSLPAGGGNFTDLLFTSASRGWVVGTGATIFLSSDGGENWIQRSSPVSSGTLYATAATPSGVGFIVGTGGSILRSTDGGLQWRLAPSGTGVALRAVHFPDNGTGYAVGDGGVILKSTDAGQSWFPVPDTILGRDYHSVHFTSRDTGWVGGTGGAMLLTTNGGTSWHQQFTLVPSTVNAVRFLNTAVGYALADRFFLSTTNGGFSWIPRIIDSANSLNALAFPSLSRGVMVADDGDIWLTSDNGGTWSRLQANVTRDLYDNFFLTDLKGWSVGARGTVLRTVNAGGTWVRDNTPTTNSLRSVYFTSEFTGWAVGDAGTVVRTIDGFNWSGVTLGVAGALSSVFFADPSTGWIVGERGASFRTTDGGTTWTDADPSDTVYSYRSVFFVDSTHGWLLGNFGDLNELTTIFRTTNRGITWDSVAMDARALLAAWFTDRDTGWAVGRFHRIIMTTDGGRTWVSQNNPSRGNTHFIDVAFADARRGWVAGGNGTILRTVDAGSTWYELDSRTNRVLYGVSFVDTLRGWVVGGNGVIVRTIDGGGDLPPEPPPPPPPDSRRNRVAQNQPNPFIPGRQGVTFIPFNLGQASAVTVQIYDDVGRLIREIPAGSYTPGSYDRDNGAPGWDGKDSRGRDVPSGVYFYRVITSEYIETQNLVLIR